MIPAGFVVLICLQVVLGQRKENCEQCLPVDKCAMYGEMTKVNQEMWIKEHPCEAPDDDDMGTLFGFAPSAKGDYVCCPTSTVWGVDTPNKPEDQDKEDSLGNKFGNYDNYQNGYPSYNDHGFNHDNLHQEQNDHLGVNENYDDDEVGYDKQKIRGQNRRPEYNRPRYNRPNNNNNYGNPMGTGRNQNMNRPYNYNGNNPGPFNRPTFNGYNTNIPNQRPYVQNQGQTNQRQNYGGQQCSISSFPPTQQSGCCGLEISGDGRQNNNFLNRPANFNSPRRFTRDTPEDFGISLDSRIAGGKQTDLYQFPWTVLLKTTFDYGGKQSTFNCGGSLISSRYVLTAAHCISEPGARIDHVDVYLAEFDKRTFPQDCINSPEGRRCIDNILTQAEGVVPHPYYDDARLQNDIALVRLRVNVPYTEFTRPICLPPINIDQPEYSDLRLAVAGWGRNGSVTSDVKQSTVVNLVPQRQCSISYPNLTNKHLCAAGKTGEDTCKGDSGGPLMMLFEGKYYVSGVVSGKRADAPCGTSVPSLYTNVFHYVNWINENVRN